MYSKAKNLLYRFWNSEGRKVFHTAWEVGLPVLVSQLLLVKSAADVKVAVVATGTVVLAALKAAYLTQKG